MVETNTEYGFEITFIKCENHYCESTFNCWHNIYGFYKIQWPLRFLNLGFQTLQTAISGKIVFRWILFSWFKRTTKSTKIRTSWLLMISQYLFWYSKYFNACWNLLLKSHNELINIIFDILGNIFFFTDPKYSHQQLLHFILHQR